MDRKWTCFASVIAAFAVAGCSSVYPLKSVANRTSDPRSLEQDVTVDISTHDTAGLKKLAWVAYSVTFECPKDCPYEAKEREQLAREIAETSFVAFDRELRHALSTSRELADADVVATRPEFAHEVKTDSFRKTVSRWFARIGLAPAPETVAAAGKLKAVDPSELGWSGAQSLADLGRGLGVDGVLVGHVLVTVPEGTGDKDEQKRLVVQGPRLWLYSSATGAAAAVAGLRPSWRLDPAPAPSPAPEADPASSVAASAPASQPTVATAPVTHLDVNRELKTEQRLDWRGFDAVATGMSGRVAQALGDR